MLVSGEAKASVEKFLEEDHPFEEYTNVSNITIACTIFVLGSSMVMQVLLPSS